MVASRHTRQGSLIRRENLEFEVLSLLSSEAGLSQREMASRLGASLGRINFCVKTMIENGNIRHFGRDAPRAELMRSYEVTQSGAARQAELAAGYLQRKQAELEHLTGQVESLRRNFKSRTSAGQA